MFFSCSKDEDNGGDEGSLNGVWVRIEGASGDETDIAIGNIPGEPENRVYMCEYVGNVGLYKGYLNGNTITWDNNYGLPDASVKRVGAQLEFSYPSVSWSIPTLYNSGQWSSHCGSLENSSIKLAVGLNNSLNSWATINSVSIDGHSVPLTLLNSGTTMPDCDSPNSYLTLPEPAQSDNNGGYYLVKVTFTAEGVSGWYTETHTTTHNKSSFNTNSCNIYQVGMNGINRFDIIPM
ncbi:MAG: hypothetical protein WCX31_21240 [Salinivirgaceae bacterium]